KFCYLVALNKKFLTQLASYLLRQIEQVLSEIGIKLRANKKCAVRRIFYLAQAIWPSKLFTATAQ
ncbi:hypothetical protein C3B51_18965, partial [Pseudoalteromonas rubra]